LEKKKVLFITYYWPPSGGAGVQRTLKFVRYVPEFGIEPIVLTVDPEKASYPVIDESLLKEVPIGVEVHKTSSFEPLKYLAQIVGRERVPHGGFTNASKDKLSQKVLRWIRGNFFIPDARVGWVKYAVTEAKRLIEQNNIDTIYVSSPPHSSQLIGLALKKWKPSLKWIADLRDPWTAIYYYNELMHTAWAGKIDAKYEKMVLQQCDHALVVSKPIQKEFALLGSIQPDKISVIPNGYDEENFDGNVLSRPQQFIINYTGTLADTYNPKSLIEAMANFCLGKPVNEIRLRFVGSMPSSIRQMLSANGLDDYCEFINYVPHAKAIRYMQAAAVNLLVIPDTGGAEGILTGKLFEYLGARRQILGIGPVKGDAAAIVEECASGKFFERESKEDISSWITSQYHEWNQHRYTRRQLSRSLSGILLKA
jgi:glycosyltransferase involved in cell wall biosynthesis